MTKKTKNLLFSALGGIMAACLTLGLVFMFNTSEVGSGGIVASAATVTYRTAENDFLYEADSADGSYNIVGFAPSGYDGVSGMVADAATSKNIKLVIPEKLYSGMKIAVRDGDAVSVETIEEEKTVSKITEEAWYEFGSLGTGSVSEKEYGSVYVTDVYTPESVYWDMSNVFTYATNLSGTGTSLKVGISAFNTSSYGIPQTYILPSPLYINGKIETNYIIPARASNSSHRFENCANGALRLIVGSGIDYLGSQSLYNNKTIQELYFATGRTTVLNLDRAAFQDTENLAEITISAGVYLLQGARAFLGCTKIANIDIAQEANSFATQFYAESVSGGLFTNAYSYDKGGASANASESYNIYQRLIYVPSAMEYFGFDYRATTEIGEYAFTGSNMKVLNIPDRIDNIASRAFSFSKFETIYLPSNATYGSRLFENFKGDVDSLSLVAPTPQAYQQIYSSTSPLISGDNSAKKDISLTCEIDVSYEQEGAIVHTQKLRYKGWGTYSLETLTSGEEPVTDAYGNVVTYWHKGGTDEFYKGTSGSVETWYFGDAPLTADNFASFVDGTYNEGKSTEPKVEYYSNEGTSASRGLTHKNITLTAAYEADEGDVQIVNKNIEAPVFQRIGNITYGVSELLDGVSRRMPALAVDFELSGFPYTRIFQGYFSDRMTATIYSYTAASGVTRENNTKVFSAGKYIIKIDINESLSDYTWSGIYNNALIAENSKDSLYFRVTVGIRDIAVPNDGDLIYVPYTGRPVMYFENNLFYTGSYSAVESSAPDGQTPSLTDGKAVNIGAYNIELTLKNTNGNLRWVYGDGTYADGTSVNSLLVISEYPTLEPPVFRADSDRVIGVTEEGYPELTITFRDSTYEGGDIFVQYFLSAMQRNLTYEKRNASGGYEASADVVAVYDAGKYTLTLAPGEAYAWELGASYGEKVIGNAEGQVLPNATLTYIINVLPDVEDVPNDQSYLYGSGLGTMAVGRTYPYVVNSSANYTVRGYHEHDGGEITSETVFTASAPTAPTEGVKVYDVKLTLKNPEDYVWGEGGVEVQGDSTSIVVTLILSDGKIDKPDFDEISDGLIVDKGSNFDTTLPELKDTASKTTAENKTLVIVYDGTTRHINELFINYLPEAMSYNIEFIAWAGGEAPATDLNGFDIAGYYTVTFTLNRGYTWKEYEATDDEDAVFNVIMLRKAIEKPAFRSTLGSLEGTTLTVPYTGAAYSLSSLLTNYNRSNLIAGIQYATAANSISACGEYTITLTPGYNFTWTASDSNARDAVVLKVVISGVPAPSLATEPDGVVGSDYVEATPLKEITYYVSGTPNLTLSDILPTFNAMLNRVDSFVKGSQPVANNTITELGEYSLVLSIPSTNAGAAWDSAAGAVDGKVTYKITVSQAVIYGDSEEGGVTALPSAKGSPVYKGSAYDIGDVLMGYDETHMDYSIQSYSSPNAGVPGSASEILNAGSYVLRITLKDGAFFEAGSQEETDGYCEVTVVVARAQISASDGEEYTYNGTDQSTQIKENLTLANSVNPEVLPEEIDDYNVTFDKEEVKNATVYRVTVTLTENGFVNFMFAGSSDSASYNITIHTASIVINGNKTAENIDYVSGNETRSVVAQFANLNYDGEIFNDGELTFSVPLTTSGADVGLYETGASNGKTVSHSNASKSGAGASNYEVTISSSAKFRVNINALIVNSVKWYLDSENSRNSLESVSEREYDGAEHNFVAFADMGGDSVELALTSQSAKNFKNAAAQPYTAQVDVGANSNYTLDGADNLEVSLTITKVKLAVNSYTHENVNFLYGNSEYDSLTRTDEFTGKGSDGTITVTYVLDASASPETHAAAGKYTWAAEDKSYENYLDINEIEFSLSGDIANPEENYEVDVSSTVLQLIIAKLNVTIVGGNGSKPYIGYKSDVSYYGEGGADFGISLQLSGTEQQPGDGLTTTVTTDAIKDKFTYSFASRAPGGNESSNGYKAGVLFEGSDKKIKQAGTYSITVTLNDSANFTVLGSSTVNFLITRAALTVSLNMPSGNSAPYDNTDHDGKVSFTFMAGDTDVTELFGGKVSSDGEYSPEGEADVYTTEFYTEQAFESKVEHMRDADVYYPKAVISEYIADNYNVSDPQGSYTITRSTVTVNGALDLEKLSADEPGLKEYLVYNRKAKIIVVSTDTSASQADGQYLVKVDSEQALTDIGLSLSGFYGAPYDSDGAKITLTFSTTSDSGNIKNNAAGKYLLSDTDLTVRISLTEADGKDNYANSVTQGADFNNSAIEITRADREFIWQFTPLDDGGNTQSAETVTDTDDDGKVDKTVVFNGTDFTSQISVYFRSAADNSNVHEHITITGAEAFTNAGVYELTAVFNGDAEGIADSYNFTHTQMTFTIESYKITDETVKALKWYNVEQGNELLDATAVSAESLESYDTYKNGLNMFAKYRAEEEAVVGYMEEDIPQITGLHGAQYAAFKNFTEESGNRQSEKGQYTGTQKIVLNNPEGVKNIEFTFETLEADENYFLNYVLSEDKETVTATKTWLIVDVVNALDTEFSVEGGKMGWTFGDTPSFVMPSKADTTLTLSLRRQGTSAIAINPESASDGTAVENYINKWLNSATPAGTWILTVSVPEHDLYAASTSTYTITVSSAAISLKEEYSGLNNAAFEFVYNGSLQLFHNHETYKSAYDEGTLVTLVTPDRGDSATNGWAVGNTWSVAEHQYKADDYFGTYSFRYATNTNGTYFDETSPDLLRTSNIQNLPIRVRNTDTPYTVYYNIVAPNHTAYSATGASDHKFTVKITPAPINADFIASAMSGDNPVKKDGNVFSVNYLNISGLNANNITVSYDESAIKSVSSYAPGSSEATVSKDVVTFSYSINGQGNIDINSSDSTGLLKKVGTYSIVFGISAPAQGNQNRNYYLAGPYNEEDQEEYYADGKYTAQLKVNPELIQKSDIKKYLNTTWEYGLQNATVTEDYDESIIGFEYKDSERIRVVEGGYEMYIKIVNEGYDWAEDVKSADADEDSIKYDAENNRVITHIIVVPRAVDLRLSGSAQSEYTGAQQKGVTEISFWSHGSAFATRNLVEGTHYSITYIPVSSSDLSSPEGEEQQPENVAIYKVVIKLLKDEVSGIYAADNLYFSSITVNINGVINSRPAEDLYKIVGDIGEKSAIEVDGLYEITKSQIKIVKSDWSDHNHVYTGSNLGNNVFTGHYTLESVSGSGAIPSRNSETGYSITYLDKLDGDNPLIWSQLINAGQYTVCFKLSEAAQKNYEVVTNEGQSDIGGGEYHLGEIEILPATLSVTANTFTYNGAEQTPSVTVRRTDAIATSAAMPKHPLVLTATEMGKTFKDAGDYEYNVALNDAEKRNFRFSSSAVPTETTQITLNIAKLGLTVSNTLVGAYYNGQEQEPNVSFTNLSGRWMGAGIPTLSFEYSEYNGAPSSAKPKNAGSYKVIITFAEGYAGNIQFGSGSLMTDSIERTFTIWKVGLSASLEQSEFDYTGEDMQSQLVVQFAALNGVVIEETYLPEVEGGTLQAVSGSGGLTTPSDGLKMPGNYRYTIELSAEDAVNFYIETSSNSSKAFSVTVKPIVLSIGDIEWSGLTEYTYTGETVAEITAKISRSGENITLVVAVQGGKSLINVGEYTLIATAPEGYSLSATASRTIVINPATVSVSLTYSTVYSAQAQEVGTGVTARFTYPSTVVNSVRTLAITDLVISGSAINAGEYTFGTDFTVVFAQGISNFMLGNVDGQFTIDRATPVISAQNAEAVYSGSAHTVSYTVSDYVNASDITVTYNGQPEAVNAGTYQVVISVAANTNYNATSYTVTLEISKLGVSVVWDTRDEYVSDGATGRTPYIGLSEDGAEAYVSLTYRDASGNTLGAAPAEAGDYSVVVSLTDDSNYYLTGEAEKTFSILPPVVAGEEEEGLFANAYETWLILIIIGSVATATTIPAAIVALRFRKKEKDAMGE